METSIPERSRLVADLTLETLRASGPSHREVHVVSAGEQSQLLSLMGAASMTSTRERFQRSGKRWAATDCRWAYCWPS